MWQYIMKRLLLIPVTLMGVYTITFILLYAAPGDPVSTLVGQHADPQTIQAIRASFGLDRPPHEQYFFRLSKLIAGDWGYSFIDHQSVLGAILSRFPASLELALGAILITVLLGIPTGVISAVRQYSALDRGLMVAAVAGVSMPSFFVGYVALLIFVYGLRWFPIDLFGSGFPGNLWPLLLPAAVLGVRGVAVVARLTRSTMLEVIRMDYIRMARAKGVKESKVIFGHALRNALLPVITWIGMDLGYLMGGAIIIETVFAWPGLGRLTVEALAKLDIPMVLGTVMFTSLLIVVSNFLTDLSYAFVDPRVKLGKS